MLILAVGIVVAALLYSAISGGGAVYYNDAPPTTTGLGGAPTSTATVDDIVAQINVTQDRMADAVPYDLDQDTYDCLLEVDYSDALFVRQMYTPAMRIPYSSPEMFTYMQIAAVFLGLDPRLPALPKGGAAGCPITKTESALKDVNAKFDSEADAAGGVGEILNIAADIFGVDTRSFDKQYGLGRAKTEIGKAKFDLSAMAGSRVGDLRKALSHATPLIRPTKLSVGGSGRGAGRNRFYESTAAGVVAKDGQTRLMIAPGVYSIDSIGMTDPKLVAPNNGPYFRAGLFQLETLSNTPSKGTVDHDSSWANIGEFVLPWNTPLLSCRLTQRERFYARAHLYKALDLLACMLYPKAGVPGLYDYDMRDGRQIRGSIFPPHPADTDTVLPYSWVEPAGVVSDKLAPFVSTSEGGTFKGGPAAIAGSSDGKPRTVAPPAGAASGGTPAVLSVSGAAPAAPARQSQPSGNASTTVVPASKTVIKPLTGVKLKIVEGKKK